MASCGAYDFTQVKEHLRKNFSLVDHELENIKLKIMLKEEQKKKSRSQSSNQEKKIVKPSQGSMSTLNNQNLN